MPLKLSIIASLNLDENPFTITFSKVHRCMTDKPFSIIVFVLSNS